MSDDQLWDLLGRSPRPTAPPFFAAKVARQIEPQKGGRRSIAWPLFRWLAPAAVAILVLFAVMPRPEYSPSAAAADFTTLDLVELLSPDDYETLTTAGWPYNNGFLSAGL
jgi:hypothetical protein